MNRPELSREKALVRSVADRNCLTLHLSVCGDAVEVSTSYSGHLDERPMSDEARGEPGMSTGRANG